MPGFLASKVCSSTGASPSGSSLPRLSFSSLYIWGNWDNRIRYNAKKKNPRAVLLSSTHMCSVETWLRLWANWDARFSSRQPKRQETSSAILPLYKRLLVVVAGRGEGRGSWFNTEERGEATVKREKRKTAPEGRDKTQSEGLKSSRKVAGTTHSL